ncbi:MAG: hypothetical protein ABIK67_04865 [candidate division WOR-3 bacterium]
MTKKELLTHLESVAKQLGIKVIYDDLRSEGGFCRCKDRYFLILNTRLSASQKINLIVAGLAKLNLAGVALLPEARLLLERERINNRKPNAVLVPLLNRR